MIFSTLAKNWKFILDIILVVAVVILVFLWNPFNLFGKGLKLQDTANMVSEIKEIGELITAEYYGEVIASDNLREVEIEEPNYFDLLASEHYLSLKQKMHKEYADAVDAAEEQFDNINNQNRKARKTAKEIAKARDQILEGKVDYYFKNENYTEEQSREVMLAMILYVGRHEYGLDQNIKKFVKRDLNDRQLFVKKTIAQVLEKEFSNIQKYTEGQENFENYITQGFTSTVPFKDFFYDFTNEIQERDPNEKKKELALIGRGSVKAGFKFGELDDRNFVYDDINNTIHFYGFKAEILNQDINPWFIPERKVPGFEILLAEKNVGFDEIKALKSKCVKLLRANAERAGILEQAQKNGEEALKTFFSLLLDDEISEVVFHSDVLLYQADDILSDDLIEKSELPVIESIVNRNIAVINDEENPIVKTRRQKLLRQFISDLKSVEKVEGLTGSKNFNYFTRHVPDILADSVISLPIDPDDSTSESRFISQVRFQILDKDSRFKVPDDDKMYWFEDSLQFLSEYNLFIDQLISKENGYKGFAIDTLVKTKPINLEKPEEIPGIIKEVMDGDKKLNFYIQEGEKISFYKRLPAKVPEELSDAKYPVIEDSLWTKYVLNDNPIEWLTPFESSINVSNATQFKYIDSVLYSTLSFDYDVFDVKLHSRRGSLTLALDSGVCQTPLEIEPGVRDIEIIAIRNFLMKHNENYQKVGPVTRNKRKFNQWVQSDSELSNGFKKTKGDLNNFLIGLKKKF